MKWQNDKGQNNMNFKMFLESEMQLKIEYHNRLNPAIWDSIGGEYQLKQEVRNHLIKIGNDFANTLNLKMDHLIRRPFSLYLIQ